MQDVLEEYCGGFLCKSTFSTGFSGLVVNEPAKPSKTVVSIVLLPRFARHQTPSRDRAAFHRSFTSPESIHVSAQDHVRLALPRENLKIVHHSLEITQHCPHRTFVNLKRELWPRAKTEIKYTRSPRVALNQDSFPNARR